MPGQGPHNAVMCRLHTANLLIGTINKKIVLIDLKTLLQIKNYNPPNIPEQNGAIGAARAKETLVYGMPGYRAGLLFVATEDLHLLTQVANVEELEQVIPGRGDQPVAIVIPLQIHYGGFVGMSVIHYKFLLKIYIIQEY